MIRIYYMKKKCSIKSKLKNGLGVWTEFPIEDIKLVKKYLKKCLSSLGKSQLKQPCDFISRYQNLRSTNQLRINAGEVVGKGNPRSLLLGMKLVQSLWKSV